MWVKKNCIKVSVVILALVMLVIFTTSVFALSPYNEEIVKHEITYITASFGLEQANDDIKLISPAEIDKIEQTDILWVDGHIAKNPEVKDKIKQVFELGGRIIILDSESNLSDIYEIFDQDQAIIIRESEEVAQEEIVEEFREEATPLNKVGYVIINEKGYKHIVTLNVEHTDLIMRTCKYASKYDYLDLVLGTESISSNLKEENGIRSGWGWGGGNWLDSNTNTNSYTYLTVTESISLQENASNPQSGKYLYYVPYRIDVDPVGTLRSLHRVDITTSAGTGNTPKIIEYGPLNSTTGTAFFNTLKGTISFPIGMRSKISRISGGLDSTNIKHRYQPWVIGPSFTYNSMRVEGHIMATRTGAFLYGTGRYSVRVGLGALHTHTYTSSASLIVSANSNNYK